MQPEHKGIDNQGYPGKFCGKKFMGNRVPLVATPQTTLSKVISPRFQCTGLTEPSTDFWREMSAVR